MPEPTPINVPHGTPPAATAGVLGADAALPVCNTCGTQYPAKRDDCPICEDPRQWVPEEGTTFTSLGALTDSHTNTLLVDPEDKRVTHIGTTPEFGINQTPILIETAMGSWIWDCAALLSPNLAAWLLDLKIPLRGIAISHPHFFSTALTWARALSVPVYINGADKDWFQRRDDVLPEDRIEYWRNHVDLGGGVELYECRGHFPGSSVLFWDRGAEANPPEDAPKEGLLLVGDTIATRLDRKGFSFLWSFPNLIPLDPPAVRHIESVLAPVGFDSVLMAWPGRHIRRGAKAMLAPSVKDYLGRIGWEVEDDKLVAVHQDEQVPSKRKKE